MREHGGLVFSLKEYRRRLDGVRTRMAERSVDHLIVSEPDNLCYLTGHQTTGYGTLQCLVIGQDQEPFTYTRLLEESNVLTRTWVEETHTYGDAEDAPASLVELLRAKGVSGTVAIEDDGFFLHQAARRALKETFPRWVNARGLVERGRVIKSDEELALMQRVARITEAGMQAGLGAVAPGVSENEIAAEVHHAMYRAGGEYPAVAPYITSGPRTIIGHATWEGRRVREGEPVFLEMAGCLKRYHTAMMRMAFVGEPPEELLRGFEIVTRNIDTLMNEMRPGVTAHHIDVVTRDAAELDAIGATRISRTGYSLGIAFAPSWDEGRLISLAAGDTTRLEAGMVFHLLPWIQLPGLEMVMAISETVQVTPGGGRSLFRFPRDIRVVSA